MSSFRLLRFMNSRVDRFLVDQRGATAIEYSLMVALIGLVIMATVFSIGQGINQTLYGRITNALAAM
jgi:Flp pilus assembly pilin Flp